MTKVLDCTLRDGGYYNDWNFSPEIAKQTVSDLVRAGVDIIEVGLKSSPDNKCSGLFKYCNEDYLDFLKAFPENEFSFMLNVNEFIESGTLNYYALDKIIKDSDQSAFTMCRLATHFSDTGMIEDFHSYFQNKGYSVGINLMGVSLLSDSNIADAMGRIEKIKPDVFYIADSFGSMLPDDISRLNTELRQYYSGPMGIHTHNNQGLAFANTLRAIEEGFEYIDATLTGMGRGAGNLATEQILLWLQNNGQISEQYQSGEVLDLIHNFYGPLQEKHKWGFNYAYMLSGLNNIHPTYCMELCDGNKFSMAQITGILESIPSEQRAKFNRIVLKEEIRKVPEQFTSADNSNILPSFSLSDYNTSSDTCLIVSTGKNISEFKLPLMNLIARKKWSVIECNNTNVLNELPQRLTIIFNKMRLVEAISTNAKLANQIVTGEKYCELKTDSRISYFPYGIDKIDFSNEKISFPDYEAGQYAITLALAMGFRNFYLAGFTGHISQNQNAVMEEYFIQITNLFKEISLTAITPTYYKSLQTRSIFTI
ncbi:aldolase catalytic domain-containing protein [Gammaproteobacteria bacterium]|nr:aldolase catalytic domain-containing protein [Gammaproteobacteria bacterium]MDC3279282.1 aldolase catalytic domain-containing protein [Gammaproteobacteria bacterium]